MSIRELLIEELQDLLHAENQLVAALPKMVAAAQHPKLKDEFDVHLGQTRNHVSRLKEVFAILGAEAKPKPCKAMMGLLEEGSETIDEGKDKLPLIADLALITAAQKVEHYEISAYGTAHALARQIGEFDVAKLLCQTLGDEEGADALLTMVAKPILQQALLDDWEEMDEDLDDDEKPLTTKARSATKRNMEEERSRN